MNVLSPQPLLAWAFLTGGLVILADFAATSELAVALAVAIAFAAFLFVGPAAAANVSTLVGGSTVTGINPSGGGSRPRLQ